MTPAWLDRSEYPFASHRSDGEGGRLHDIDEGEGPPILMVHGTPTWSFLMRDPAFGGYLPRWRSALQRAEVPPLHDCGHAPPEERAPELLPTLERFLQAA